MAQVEVRPIVIQMGSEEKEQMRIFEQAFGHPDLWSESQRHERWLQLRSIPYYHSEESVTNVIRVLVTVLVARVKKNPLSSKLLVVSRFSLVIQQVCFLLGEVGITCGMRGNNQLLIAPRSEEKGDRVDRVYMVGMPFEKVHECTEFFTRFKCLSDTIMLLMSEGSLDVYMWNHYRSQYLNERHRENEDCVVKNRDTDRVTEMLRQWVIDGNHLY